MPLCASLAIYGSDLSHTTPLSPNRHTIHFNVYKIWLKWTSRISLLGDKKAWGGVDYTLIQEWNRKEENWWDYMNKFYVPKCGYKLSHHLCPNFASHTELHPHSETTHSLPKISSLGTSWCALGKTTSCELLNQPLDHAGSRSPLCLYSSCSKLPISALPRTSVLPTHWKGSLLWVVLSEIAP